MEPPSDEREDEWFGVDTVGVLSCCDPSNSALAKISADAVTRRSDEVYIC
jgi:hypothetical protein